MDKQTVEDCFHPSVELAGNLISINESCAKIEITEICTVCNEEVDEYTEHYYSRND